MKRTISYIIVAIACVAAFGSCKKSESGAAAKSSLLTAGRWTFQRFEYLKKDGTWEYYQPGAAITLEFRGDGTMTMVNGSGSSARTWSLSGDLTQLTIARTGGADTFTVLQLTSSTLQLSPVGYSSTTYLEERDTYAR